MSVNSAFNNLPRIVQLLLLIIPGVNWITEVIVRWSAVLGGKTNIFNIVLAVVVIFGVGVILGWVDFFCVLLFKHLAFA